MSAEKKKRYAVVDMDALNTLIKLVRRGDYGRQRREAMEQLEKELRIQHGISADQLPDQFKFMAKGAN